MVKADKLARRASQFFLTVKPMYLRGADLGLNAESENCREQDKEDAYQSILRDFQDESTRLDDESLTLHSQRLLKLLSRDILLVTENVVNLCLQVMHLCLRASYFRSSQSSDSTLLLQSLIQCAQKVSSIDLLKKDLECLASQDFPSSILVSQISSLIEIVETANAKAKSQSHSLLEETVNLLFRLQQQISTALKPFAKRWARFVFPGVASSSDDIREKNVISDPKRIKLLMMVFRYDIARAEPVAVEKMLTWWHFVLNIGQKLTANFEKIIYPMLQFCVGNGKIQVNQPSRIALKPSSTNLQTSVLSPQSRNSTDLAAFPAVQKLGLEAVALLLSKPLAPGCQDYLWNLQHLPFEVFGGSTTFAKHATFLLNVTHHLFRDLSKDLNESLIIYTWTALAGHIKTGLEGATKSELRDVFSLFLTNLHSMVQEKTFSSKTLFKMTEVCSSFPAKVLASTAFNVSCTVRGSPVLLLSEVLLSPLLMEASSDTESYMKLFSFLVESGASNKQGALQFLQTVSDLIDSNAESLKSSEILWKMWNILAHTLQNTIIASNEVNQGDALEYNFGCMIAVLLLPVNQQLASKVSQAVFKAMLKSWKELYHSFARLSALVPTAEANACLEELCGKIIQKCKVELKEPSYLEFLSSVAQKMLDCIDFSAFPANQGSGALLTLSPSKWARRRQRPLGNLHSFIHLLEVLQRSLNTLIFKEDSGEKQQVDNSAGLIFAAHNLIDLFSSLFMHVNTPALIFNSLCVLAEPIAKLYCSNSQYNQQRLVTKLEKLWHEIALCINGRYSDPYNSELLAKMSPLFEATFLHPKRVIKNQAVTLWNTTFSRAPTLEYPASLKPILAKVKEKMPIALPGWIAPEDIPVIAESPYSEMSMGLDSQAPPPLPLALSPKRSRASMLNKDLSPVRIKNLSPPSATTKASPAKVMTPKEARKLFAPTSYQNVVDLLPEKEFVVISSPANKKKRLLTEHQKEVLKEKSVLPAMYNNLDASQDISLMSQFGTETQNEFSTHSAINSSSSQNLGEKSKLPAIPPPDLEKIQSVRSSKRRSERLQSKESTLDSEHAEASKLNNMPSLSETSISIPSTSVVTQSCSKPELSIANENTSNTSPYQDNSSLVENATNDDSPFVMFRQKAPSSPPLSLSQDYESNRHKSVPRRISLRRIQSEDPVSGSGKREDISQKNRDHLQKPGAPENKKEKQKCGKNIPNVLSDKLNNLSKKTDQGIKVPNTSAEAQTLVEDTQSPVKVQKQNCKAASQSITETPTKSDDSPSPHLRSSSARKLFVDEEPKSKHRDNSDAKTPLSGKQQGSVSSTIDCPSANVNLEDVISSSQGFEPAQETNKETARSLDHVNLFGFSELVCQEPDAPSTAQEMGTSQEPIVITNDQESENVVLTSQESDNFLHSMMPTMASPSAHPQSSLSSSKSSVASMKTQITSSDTVSSKNSSTPEADFFPVQPTLKECSLKETVNKRKRVTPKKYSPEKISRRARYRFKDQVRALDEQRNEIDCGKDTKHNSAAAESEILTSANNNPSTGVAVIEAFNGSPVFGEITPDMKSPLSGTPQRGHSSIKRKKKFQQEVNGNPKARKSISPDADKNVDKDSDFIQQKQRKCTLQLASAAHRGKKRRLLSSLHTKISKSKHLLRARRKCNSSSPPPRKVRKLQTDTAGEKNKRKIFQPSQSNKQEEGRTPKENKDKDSESDDDIPLVNYKISKCTNVPVLVEQGNSVLSEVTGKPKSLNSDSGEQSLVNDMGNKGYESPNAKSHMSINVSTPDKDRRFKIVDEALSTALSQMVNEMSKQHEPIPQEECTPLLLSEDINADADKEPAESQDHLQAGQITLNSNNTCTSQDDSQAMEHVRPENLSQLPAMSPTERVEPQRSSVLLESEIRSNVRDAEQHNLSKVSKVLPVTRASSFVNGIENQLQPKVTDSNQNLETSPEMQDQDEANEVGNQASKQLSEPFSEMNEVNQSKSVIDSKTLPEPRVMLHKWSPSKSPSFSILKKATGTPSPGRNRVSFAEPVVNGESPVREKYHSESLPTSPLIAKSGTQRKGTPFARSLGKISGYKRKLNPSAKQVRYLQSPGNVPASPVKSQSPSQHKATQESQLDSVNPIFPDLVDCTKPVEEILPQLTSSLWYRGLHHMMKGRSLNTIGDLSALTEVQINQLPIRNPKIDTVRTALKNYTAQHGLFKPMINFSSQDKSSPLSSKGATLEQAVTPSNIADEGMEVRSHIDDEIDRLSPIETIEDIEPEPCIPSTICAASLEEEHGAEKDASNEPISNTNTSANVEKSDFVQPNILVTLSKLVDDTDGSRSLKNLNPSELFEVHQKLNSLFGAVVEEMKARHSQVS
ncbi:telomere-associated protein rif1-like [Plakobranchus ocellatus]|uniref:Telomere-associated protein rif1-like n=1 Tax=Plakobranchus ocellatus TaxID=259542 RepID=A0AAV4C3G4_9GAST|nr:telomere-associated protein rif1-like [Plakobranchus ocellatus]